MHLAVSQVDCVNNDFDVFRGTSKEHLTELFSEHGTVVGFKFFQ